MNIKVLGGNFQTKRFDSIEDFNEYYNKHKSDMDAMTTQRLNKLFSIDGYHIVRRSENICILPLNNIQNDKPVRTKELAARINSHEEQISAAVNEVNELKNTVTAQVRQQREFADRVDNMSSQIKQLSDVINDVLNYLKVNHFP